MLKLVKVWEKYFIRAILNSGFQVSNCSFQFMSLLSIHSHFGAPFASPQYYYFNKNTFQIGAFRFKWKTEFEVGSHKCLFLSFPFVKKMVRVHHSQHKIPNLSLKILTQLSGNIVQYCRHSKLNMHTAKLSKSYVKTARLNGNNTQNYNHFLFKDWKAHYQRNEASVSSSPKGRQWLITDKKFIWFPNQYY